jgi:Tfp pilus assembly protein PilO
VKKQVPLTPVLALALVIVVAVGWFALVGPKRSEAARLDEEIGTLQMQLATAVREQAKPEEAGPVVEIDVADVFRLAKAMPDREDMPAMLLELNSIAVSTGVQFRAIQPGTAVTRGAYYTVPVNLTFEGNYYDLTDFLFRLRSLVSVRDGVLEANGRLYTLDAIEFHESAGGFPRIEAVLTVSAYSFGTAPALGAAPPPVAPAQSGTTQTGTGQTTTGATTTGTTPPASPPPATTPPATPPPPGEQQAAGGTG